MVWYCIFRSCPRPQQINLYLFQRSGNTHSCNVPANQIADRERILYDFSMQTAQKFWIKSSGD